MTYGAGGSTRERTHATVERILKETSLTPAAHLTCVGATREEVDEVAQRLLGRSACGISSRCAAIRRSPACLTHRIRAAMTMRPIWSRASRRLRRSTFRSPPIRNSIRIPARVSADLDNLKRKVDAGADRAITQFFFSPDCFLRFQDAVAAAGMDIEVVPGILPVSNVATTRRFAQSCGASIPRWLDDLFEGLDDLPSARQLIAATVAAELCGQLYAGGVRHFHFYTLNRAELSYAICHLLGVRAQGKFRNDPSQTLRAEAAKRILIKDGAYGTSIQDRKLQSADYCGGLDL